MSAIPQNSCDTDISGDVIDCKSSEAPFCASSTSHLRRNENTLLFRILEARTTNDTSLADAYAIAHPPTDKRTTVNFDPTLQYVSTTGQHAFIPPGPGDFRGPCPGLNAMANHGYIPRNGIATIDQFVDGTYTVFGMGRDLALILATYGTVLSQQLRGRRVTNERGFIPINNYDVQMSQFRQLYDLQSNVSDPSQVNYDIPLLTSFRVSRFQQSIANNPYFVNGAFSGIAVQPAAYQFIYRFMANKSEEYPEGRLDREVLKSFYAISGSEDQFVYTSGYERIPNNWYKRAIGDEYGMVPFAIELGLIALAHPEFLSIGGNTGQVDTFTGVNLADLTRGVYNANTLLEGNNLLCFVLQAAVMNLPTSVAGLLEGVLNDLAGITCLRFFAGT
ncbi:oxidase-like protein [Lentinula edodes]|uniref:Oxidase-like protein n=1 Tax=Lentinula edodes TaxID=5353 RepID=A0A1Q3EBH3_LENED|nr:oxidase-like protein [Lentinula edodes]